ncbi:MAG: hypothetical protein AAGE65_01915 [Planctomycetota bacterium]
MDASGQGGFPGGGAWGQARFARRVITRRSRLPVRLGVMSALLVGVVPIVAIVALAVLVGGLVYAVSSAIAKVLSLVGLGGGVASTPTDESREPLDDGRENVRVMGRPEP